MLSISAMGGGQEAYYLDLAQEGYYLKGGEPPGRWLGSGASWLDLKGQVTAVTLGHLLAGRSPDGAASLVQRQTYGDGRTRQPGWDLTFSAPKSVSVLWSQADSATRASIQEAHFTALSGAMNYLEEAAVFTRRGRGGETVESGLLAAAVFEHGTSRAEDPQLHSHVLVPNLARREDGTFGTLRSRDLYRHQVVAGTFYRAELARGLVARLGVALQAVDRHFEITGVPDTLLETFSKRRAIIVEALAESGVTGAKAAEIFALSTRDAKRNVAREDLFETWGKVGRDHGFSAARVLGTVAVRPLDHEAVTEVLRRISRRALADLSRFESHFFERELLRLVLERSQHLGYGGDLVRASVRALLADPSRVVSIGVESGFERFTTPATLDSEINLLRLADASRGRLGASAAEKTIKGVVAKRASMNVEQVAALEHLTDGRGSVKCLVGMAGTGKTFLLKAAREAWEKEGMTVLGAALAAKAALGLRKEAGIESRTIKSLLMTIEARRAAGQEMLDAKSVLVVDEAGMVDTRNMERLLVETSRAGAKLVLVGDPRQLQPIEAGGPFAALVERLGAKTLSTIVRQHEEWMREAVHQFAAGDARGGLGRYAEAGYLEVAATKAAAVDGLIEHWKRDRTADLKESLVLAGTNVEVDELNEKVQSIRLRAREIDDRKVVFSGRTRFLIGDRVVVGRNDRTLGVMNGDFGVVEDITRSPILGRPRLLIRLDRTEPRTAFFGLGAPCAVRILLDDLESAKLRLGYAVTTHKAQGATVDRTFVLAGGWMQDRELSYVQMSRAREKTWVFTSEADAGEDLSLLASTMSRSRGKTLAVEHFQTRGADRSSGIELSLN